MDERQLLTCTPAAAASSSSRPGQRERGWRMLPRRQRSVKSSTCLPCTKLKLVVVIVIGVTHLWRARVPGACSAEACCHPASPIPGRRVAIAASVAAPSVALMGAQPVAAKRPACGNIEDCRALGEARFEELERARGPIIEMGDGLRYRETLVGTGSEEVAEGDVVDITYEVRRATTGDYMYSFGRGRPDMPRDDFGETYRVQVGAREVPLGVEKALIGMRKGGSRTVELPRRYGFETSAFRPEPTNFSGKRRMERFRTFLAQNRNGPITDSRILMEVEVVRLRKAASP